jgi:GxxExxY protein
MSSTNRQEAEGAKSEPELAIDNLAHSVIGAAIQVHRYLGPGYLESVYEEALAIELALRGLSHERQSPVGVEYKGHIVGESRLDLIVERRLIVELKTVERLAPIHRAQVVSYLKATGLHLALLINFNEVVLRNGIRRIILT